METQTVRLLGEGMETQTVKGTGGGYGDTDGKGYWGRAWRHRR